MLKDLRIIFVMFAVLLMAACAQMQLDTTNKKVTAAYATVQTVAETTTQLYKAGKLTKDDANAIIASNDAALAGLDAVRTMPADAAASRLTQILAVLNATQAYLATRSH